MATDLERMLRERFGVKPSAPGSKNVGIVLPKAFIATTTKRIGFLPEGTRVIAEQNVLGNFALTWWDEQDREQHAAARPEEIDLSDVWAGARAELLAQIETRDLEAEIARRAKTGREVAA